MNKIDIEVPIERRFSVKATDKSRTKPGLIQAIDTNLKLIALAVITCETLCIVGLTRIDNGQRIYVLIGGIAVMLITVVLAYRLQRLKDKLEGSSERLIPKPLNVETGSIAVPPQFALFAARAAKLNGRWVGSAQQTQGPDGAAIDAEVDMLISANERGEITGEGKFKGLFRGEKVVVVFTFAGGFMHPNYVRLRYDPKDPGTVQFGSVILEFTGHGDRLRGKYVGFGALMNQIVDGKLDLTPALVTG